MNRDDILRALENHRAARKEKSSGGAYSPSAHLPAVATPPHGHHVAVMFAEEVVRTLDHRQIFQLAAFLSRETGLLESNKLREQLAQQLEEFYAAEIGESGLDRTRLRTPAGPINADFGLVLHMQLKEGSACKPFWDMDNTTICMLDLKSVSENFTFSFNLALAPSKTDSGKVTLYY